MKSREHGSPLKILSQVMPPVAFDPSFVRTELKLFPIMRKDKSLEKTQADAAEWVRCSEDLISDVLTNSGNDDSHPFPMTLYPSPNP